MFSVMGKSPPTQRCRAPNDNNLNQRFNRIVIQLNMKVFYAKSNH